MDKSLMLRWLLVVAVLVIMGGMFMLRGGEVLLSGSEPGAGPPPPWTDDWLDGWAMVFVGVFLFVLGWLIPRWVGKTSGEGADSRSTRPDK
ncbi:MAG: hypothetical protein R6V05_01705 [Candidatus Brocadiia bacterium]